MRKLVNHWRELLLSFLVAMLPMLLIGCETVEEAADETGDVVEDVAD